MRPNTKASGGCYFQRRPDMKRKPRSDGDDFNIQLW